MNDHPVLLLIQILRIFGSGLQIESRVIDHDEAVLQSAQLHRQKSAEYDRVENDLEILSGRTA